MCVCVGMCGCVISTDYRGFTGTCRTHERTWVERREKAFSFIFIFFVVQVPLRQTQLHRQNEACTHQLNKDAIFGESKGTERGLIDTMGSGRGGRRGTNDQAYVSKKHSC